MKITIESFNKICRSCLNEELNMKSLFTKIEGSDQNLANILTYTTNININNDDKLPKQVCNSCITFMYKAESFKRRVYESEEFLTGILDEIKITVEEDPTKCYVKNENDVKIDQLYPLDATNMLEDSVKKMILCEFDVYPECGRELKPQDSDKIKKEINEDSNDDFSNFHDSENISEITTECKTEMEEKHTCYCKKNFDTKSDYNTHLQNCHCDKYKHLFKKISKSKVIQIKNQISCQECDRKFNTVSGWMSHQRSHNDKKKSLPKIQKCNICSQKFKHKKTLIGHLRRHENEPITYVCDKCDREFKYKKFLVNHIISFHSGDGIVCDICTEKFTDKKSYDEHRETHRVDKKNQCRICKKVFYMSSTLKDHMRTHTGEKPFLCSQCGRGFSQRNNMIQHMRRHLGDKPFKCEDCEKSFVSKGELDAHTRKHSGAHPFVCNECGNGFTTSSSLVKHRRIHTGERPYACDMCPMRFAATGTLKNHRRTHTGERPYQCTYCDKAFTQKNDLTSHTHIHTGERPYVCAHCGQRFRKPAGLKAHARLHSHQAENVLPAPQGEGMMVPPRLDGVN